MGFGAFNLLGLVFLRVLVTMGDKLGGSGNSPFKSVLSDPNYLHWMWITGLIHGLADCS